MCIRDSDLRIAQGGDAFFGNMPPEIQLVHEAHRGVGESDFASVKGRFCQGLFWLAFHKRHFQRLIGQGFRQTQTYRACTDDDDIVTHGIACV